MLSFLLSTDNRHVMAVSPFFSGRIPQSLWDAVESYRQQAGESKTDVLVKALSAYIGVPIEDQQTKELLEPGWRKNLETRIETLERLMAGMQQELNRIPIEKDRADKSPEQAPPGQMTLYDLQKLENSKEKESPQESPDNSIDNKIDNSVTTPDNEADNEADNRDYILTHAEVAEQTGMKIGSVRNAHSKKKPITRTEQGRRYVPEQKNAWIVEIL